MTDIERFGARPAAERRDVRTRLLDAEQRAARNCGLPWGGAFIQSQGDGDLMAWQSGRHDVRFVARYPADVSQELHDINGPRRRSERLRIRMALSAGVSEIAGATMDGNAAVTAKSLIDSESIRVAMSVAADSPLALIVDESLYRSVVEDGFGGLRPARFVEVRFRDKRDVFRHAWVTVPDADPGVISALRTQLDDSRAGPPPVRHSEPIFFPGGDMNAIDHLLDTLTQAVAAGASAGTTEATSSLVVSTYQALRKRISMLLSTKARQSQALIDSFERTPLTWRPDLAEVLRIARIDDDVEVMRLLGLLDRALREQPTGGHTFVNSNGNVVGSNNTVNNSTHVSPQGTPPQGTPPQGGLR